LTSPAAIQILLIDLDDTVYPPGNGLWEQISTRIDAYMRERLGLSSAEITFRRQRYVSAFGTTLTGLMHDFDIDPADYLEFVHQVDYAALLKPDPELREALLALPQSKSIFTNASREHALHVLEAVGLGGLFEHIIDIVSLDYRNKPLPEAYVRAVTLAGASTANACLMADDRPVNLAPARELGMTTVLVGPGPSQAADIHLGRLAELPQAIAALVGSPAGSRADHNG
jgi:putative hydrolase of the HAD superfamily